MSATPVMITRSICVAGLALAVLAGCAGQPFDYHPVDQIPKGRGLFSDQEDGYVIYDSARKHSQGVSAEANEFHEWKKFAEGSAEGSKEYKEYREFQEWKKSAEGSREYQEFQEWREWKAYKEWKKKQSAQQ